MCELLRGTVGDREQPPFGEARSKGGSQATKQEFAEESSRPLVVLVPDSGKAQN